MLKSARMLSRRRLMFHIFTEEGLKKEYKQTLDSWPEWARRLTDYKLYDIQYPDDGPISAAKWRKLYKQCCTQRLFFPKLLPAVDAVIYVDTDVLFLRPVEDVWDVFRAFNSTALAVMVPEHEDPNIGWYNRFARHPYYGKTGMNSGVMLMNLTRLREVKFIKEVTKLCVKHEFDITWGDQDLLNIYFHHHPERLKLKTCEWNYRPDHCMYGSNCPQAEERGAYVLHGSREYFHKDKQPPFKAIYRAVRDHDLKVNDLSLLLSTVRSNMKSAVEAHSGCGEAQTRHKMLTKGLEKQVIEYSKRSKDEL